MKEDKIVKPYFSHDYTPLEDKNLLKLFITMGVEGYGLYWLIVEYMHQNTFCVGDEELIAFKYRIEKEKIEKVMNDFNLFRIEETETETEKVYISDRILRNLNYVEQKNGARAEAANVRWLLSAFNKAYTEFYGEAPVLMPDEIENLKLYSKKVPDLKDKLRDIIYTMTFIRFDTKFEFKQKANWLLAKNNLARILNGEFGDLKHKKTPKELREEQRQSEQQKREENKPNELDLHIEAVTTKEEALALIAEYYRENALSVIGDKAILLPSFKPLMRKFKITEKEVIGLCR